MPTKEDRVGNDYMKDLHQVEGDKVAAKETDARWLTELLIIVEKENSSHDGAG